jgi:uncharacterized protein
MREVGAVLQFSPSDLTAFLESEFASWMDRWYLERMAQPHVVTPTKSDVPQPLSLSIDCQPDEQDEETLLYAGKGIEHEKTFLEGLRSQGMQVIEIDQDGESARATLDAMKAGAELIYQARLEMGDFAGWADFLAKQIGESALGKHHYEVWDTKLARSAKPYFVVQLCAYAEMLEQMQNKRPVGVEVILGSGEARRFRTNSYFYYYRELKRQFSEFQGSFDPTSPPHPGLSKSFGRWETYAESVLAAADHLSVLANITRGQIKKLESAGISTATELARSKINYVSGIAAHVLDRLKAQSRLQMASRGLPKPLFEVRAPAHPSPRQGLALVPPASPSDVFFDMEGFPLVDGGLEYLFGAVYLDGDKAAFKDWWAHDALQEKQSFEGFMDWVFARWTQDPTMHVYHYASYEPSAMKRLMGKYATREQQVDELLRHAVFVDLYTVVRQGLVIGTLGYSLKDIEALYREKREGKVKTASASVVAYAAWQDSGESPNWQESNFLREIRDYNQIDCESLLGLAGWLREVQRKEGIEYCSGKEAEAEEGSEDNSRQVHPATILAEKLLTQVVAGEIQDPERTRVQELLAWLLEFHWREAKPVFWRMFDRSEMSEQELVDDLDCLGALERTSTPPQKDKRSWLYEYSFDPEQDTKFDVEDKCFFAHDLQVNTAIISMNREQGLLTIKLGPSKPVPPDRLSLIPNERVSAETIAQAIQRYVERWTQGQPASMAVDDLLCRRPPRVTGHNGGAIVDPDTDLLPQVTDIVQRLDDSLLCIQGPPGSGKTYTSAAVIVELLRSGKRIGVTANSHKAILNVLDAVARASETNKIQSIRIVKVGGDDSDPLIQRGTIQFCKDSKSAPAAMGDGPVVVGGTAWLFCRSEMEGQLDYLFIDEAGQFSLANVVGVGSSAKNLVLVGDQMQLAQPTQGSHPGESGKSGLEYFLNGKATIPPDLGILLNTTWRMHPDVCNFISEAIYENRLIAHSSTKGQRVILGRQSPLELRETGIQFVPVQHEGNSQCSPEEIDQVDAIVKELLSRKVQDADGRPSRPLTWDDILVVAPYNMQVRRIVQRLGPNARVGSVDKFQGLEAHVVIVSMCASSLEESPRGAEFLLSANRINVAVSRAKSLAIVLASPKLLTGRCQTIEQMELVNLFCWLKAYSEKT